MYYSVSFHLTRFVLRIRQHIFKREQGRHQMVTYYAQLIQIVTGGIRILTPLRITPHYLALKFPFPTDLKYYLDNIPTCHKYIDLFMDFLFYFNDLFVYSYTTS